MHENYKIEVLATDAQLKEESKRAAYLYAFLNKRSLTAHKEFLAYRRTVSQLAQLVPETFKPFLCVVFHPLVSSQSTELKNKTGGTKELEGGLLCSEVSGKVWD